MSSRRILTDEEREAERVERGRNPGVLVSGVCCHCGAKKKITEGFWIWSQDQVSIECTRGHTSILRFIPETVS